MADQPAPLLIKPSKRRRSLAIHADLLFWLYFLLLNALLFLPAYLADAQTSTFFPPVFWVAADPARVARDLLLWRNNLDIFRLSAELTLLLALWVLLPWSRLPRLRRLFRWFLAITYLFALAYVIYESLTISIYQVDAVFYAHAQMVIDGLGFLLRHLQVQWWLIAVGAFLIALAIFGLLSIIRAAAGGIPEKRLSKFTKVALTLLALLSLLALGSQKGGVASRKSVVSSLAYKLQKNAAASFTLYQSVRSMDDLALKQVYDYSGHDLLAKPDIYLIFIESYGSILYKEPQFNDAYTKLVDDLAALLQDEGWHASTVLSESPTWGGGSWMAYTSAVFGMRVDNHPQYLALLERFQDEAYPDLGNYLQSQGYEYVRATSLAAELPDDEWQSYVNFFGVDRWIRYSDLAYEGMHYGWGPSPPDQYVLQALNEDINGRSDQPFLLFWITQNSHYPWREVPQMVDDWRAMNDGKKLVAVYDDEKATLSGERENYFNAIRYELSFLTDFIINEADDEALFILIGDHQPGYITRRDDGFDTPIHIISKDRAFVESFAGYGFESGLKVDNPQSAMRHEGLYSLFMRALLEQYGHGDSQLPPYFPDGIQLPFD